MIMANQNFSIVDLGDVFENNQSERPLSLLCLKSFSASLFSSFCLITPKIMICVSGQFFLRQV